MTRARQNGGIRRNRARRHDEGTDNAGADSPQSGYGRARKKAMHENFPFDLEVVVCLFLRQCAAEISNNPASQEANPSDREVVAASFVFRRVGQ